MTPAELGAVWELVKDLQPLRPHELEHFTRSCFRDSPGQPKGWVREYVPRIVRTLVGELRDAGNWSPVTLGPGVTITGDFELRE